MRTLRNGCFASYLNRTKPYHRDSAVVTFIFSEVNRKVTTMNARPHNVTDTDNVTDLQQSVRDLAQAEKPRKSSSEAIADQAVSILSRANAHVFDQLDALHAKLNELRAVQASRMAAAEDAVRAAMEWSEYVTESTAKLDSAITAVRGETARSVS